MRGGISIISRHYAKAIHPDFNDIAYYDKGKLMCQILYLDANNLYGWAMSQFLPVSHCVWMSINELKRFTVDWIRSLASDGEQGYIFEVDFAASNENLPKFAGYPFAPEMKSIRECELSPHQRRILKEQFKKKNESRKKKLTDAKLEEKVNSYMSTETLIPDLKAKTKYILHYRTLQLYLQLGLKLTKIHRVLCFKQKAWLNSYITANTMKR